MKLIDYPEWIPIDDYFMLRDKITNDIAMDKNIISIYQMGSVKNPGISDLDIICVFKDNSFCNVKFREELKPHQKKILTHGLFAVQESDFLKACTSNYISNLNLLYGRNFNFNTHSEIPECVKIQVALEYMLRLYITMEIQLKTRIIKIRSFLLLAKAIKYDLELLGVTDGDLYDQVEKIIEIRDNWFKKSTSKKAFLLFFYDFFEHYKYTLAVLLNKYNLVLEKETYNLTHSILITQSKVLKFNHRGIILPSHFAFLGRKYFNLQYRFNSFHFEIPYIINNELNTILNDRASFAKKLQDINRKQFPHFLTLNSSLSIT